MSIDLIGGDIIIDTYKVINRQAGREIWSVRINALFRINFEVASMIGSMIVGQLTDHLRGEALIWLRGGLSLGGLSRSHMKANT